MNLKLKIPYKWDLLITWTLPVPKLPKFRDVMKKCKSKDCVSEKRYKASRATMTTAEKRYLEREDK